MTIKISGLALALAFVLAPAYAQVFKCKNSEGKVEYQSAPCASSAAGEKQLDIKVDKMNSDPRVAKFAEMSAVGKVLVGMPEEYVIRAWGRPTSVNRTVTGDRVSEQWVYQWTDKTGYLYLENGVLTSIQN